MPEHLDDFDLDRAFADLLEDVSGRTTPPSASAIIERARRRRTTILAAAAAVVLIAGATAVASGMGRPSAAPGPSGQLPAPHVLDRDAWTAATDGWIDGWKQPSNEDQMAWLNGDPVCLASMPDTGPEPERSGRLALMADTHAAMFSALADFNEADAAETSWRQLSNGLGGCADATLLRRATWDGAQAESYRIDSQNRTDYFWLARHGQSLGVLWVAERSTPPLPDATDTRVMTALVAGMQDPDSFKQQDSGSVDTGSASSSASVAVPQDTVADKDFAAALGSWDSGWERAGDKVANVSLACLSSGDLTSGGSMGGFGTSVGTNGSYETSWFSDEATARQAFSDLVDQLRSCSTPTTVDLVDGQPQVAVISSKAGVAWIVRNGPAIGAISIDGAHANPPAEVSAAVGEVIDRALRTTTP